MNDLLARCYLKRFKIVTSATAPYWGAFHPAKGLLASPERLLGTSRECAFRCSPHVRTRPPRGLGVPKFSRGPPREVLGTPRNPRKRIWGSLWDSRGASRVHFRVFGARLSLRRTVWEAKVRSSNSPKCSIGANPAKLCSKFFFRGRRLWPQAISYVQLLRSALGLERERGNSAGARGRAP